MIMQSMAAAFYNFLGNFATGFHENIMVGEQVEFNLIVMLYSSP